MLDTMRYKKCTITNTVRILPILSLNHHFFWFSMKYLNKNTTKNILTTIGAVRETSSNFAGYITSSKGILTISSNSIETDLFFVTNPTGVNLSLFYLLSYTYYKPEWLYFPYFL